MIQQFIYQIQPFLVILVLVFAIAISYKMIKGGEVLKTFSTKNMLSSYELCFLEMEVNDTKSLFLVDTGSNKCLINQDLLDKKHLEKTTFSNTVTSTTGNKVRSRRVVVDYKINNKAYQGSFQASDLSQMSKDFEDNFGLKIQGLLGTDFLLKHKVVINYKTQKIIVHE